MSTQATAIRLAGKLTHLTAAGKLQWNDAGSLGPWVSGQGRYLRLR